MIVYTMSLTFSLNSTLNGSASAVFVKLKKKTHKRQTKNKNFEEENLGFPIVLDEDFIGNKRNIIACTPMCCSFFEETNKGQIFVDDKGLCKR